jgi:hypothetical protein
MLWVAERKMIKRCPSFEKMRTPPIDDLLAGLSEGGKQRRPTPARKHGDGPLSQSSLTVIVSWTLCGEKAQSEAEGGRLQSWSVKEERKKSMV